MRRKKSSDFIVSKNRKKNTSIRHLYTGYGLWLSYLCNVKGNLTLFLLTQFRQLKKTDFMKTKRIMLAFTAMLIAFGNINAQNMETEVPKISEFPVGNENAGFEKYFTGKSWLAPLTTNKDLNVPMFNVTFEPGCRNNWHSHTGGQILIAVGGVGYYQERGKAARRLVPGDVVEIAPNVEHWHGAAPDSWFSHIAVECNPGTNKNTWLERVDDEAYAKATK